MEKISLYIYAMVQGITEWLPVSSSGHLALLQNIPSLVNQQVFQITIFLHFASLVALLIFFTVSYYSNKRLTKQKNIPNIQNSLMNAHKLNKALCEKNFSSNKLWNSLEGYLLVLSNNSSVALLEVFFSLTKLYYFLLNFFTIKKSTQDVARHNHAFRRENTSVINRQSTINKTSVIVRLLLLVIVADLPAIVVGFFLRKSLATSFTSTGVLAACFAATALLLLSIRLKKTEENKTTVFSLTIKQALYTGVCQCFALLPGVSRSGTTIAVATLLGVKGKDAAYFSLMLLAPLVMGASVLEVILNWGNPQFLAIGFKEGVLVFLLTVAVSLLALQVLTYFATKYKLHYFSVYLFVLAGYLLLAT